MDLASLTAELMKVPMSAEDYRIVVDHGGNLDGSFDAVVPDPDRPGFYLPIGGHLCSILHVEVNAPRREIIIHTSCA